ncbi:hypothetical protein OH76DRAFT_1483049 [Lentinus brumalis]|uniref:C2H2-type domain-containing protein n=1 Tax=Lentinus brumalis TaxID=2498619 RepID=A0A371DA06_9APHY|nr:hypothetical protein OH76DRAFT_1483049 [Polyporus brumalis]
MSTPPPECDSRSASVASVSGRTTTASGHKKAYRRVFAAELKATSQVSVARKRKRAEKAASAVAAVRSIVCQWGGCGERMANGTQLWSHIERVHRPLGGGGPSKGAERRQKEEEEEEDMSIDEASGHIHSYDRDCDELDDSSDEEWAESSRSGAVTKSKPHMGMDRYQIRIRCQWKRCTTTIQFAGLRRHIESKHSGLRNTSCPKGCGYMTNRPDMMPRHRNKCHYRGPRKDVVVDE